MKTTTTIQEQALLVRVVIRKWSNAKTDSGLTQAVEADNNIVGSGLLHSANSAGVFATTSSEN